MRYDSNIVAANNKLRGYLKQPWSDEIREKMVNDTGVTHVYAVPFCKGIAHVTAPQYIKVYLNTDRTIFSAVIHGAN